MEEMDRINRGYHLFDAALDLRPEDRSSYLDKACATEPDLRAYVEGLLAAAASDMDLITNPLHLQAGAKEEETTLPTGTVIDERFRIIGELGNGGMGIVYQAEDLKLSRKVALKQARSAFRDSFKREFMLSGFRHPNIPKVYDVIQSGEERIMVMEYIEGEALDEKLKTPGYSYELDQVLDWATTILKALAYLHTFYPSNQTVRQEDIKPTLHRDIKPSNLMLSLNGHLFLLDFGIAKRGESPHSMDSTARGYGTLPYAAPEQIGLLNTPVSARSDLYALGATLFHLLFGTKPPYEEARMEAVQHGQADPLEEILAKQSTCPLEVTRWLQRAMALDPAARWASAVAMEAALQRIRAHEPVWKKRKPLRYWFLSAAGLVALLLGTVLSYAWYTNPSIQAASAGEGSRVDSTAIEQPGLVGEEDAIAHGGTVPDTIGQAEPPPQDEDSEALPLGKVEAPSASAMDATVLAASPEAENVTPSEQPRHIQTMLSFSGLVLRGQIYVDGDPGSAGTRLLSVGPHRLSAKRAGYHLQKITLNYHQDGSQRSIPFYPENGVVSLSVDATMGNLRVVFYMKRDALMN